MGKNNSAKHISEVGNYGDGREFYACKHVMENAQPMDPSATLKALEDFDLRWTMLHLGSEKGAFLDRAVREAIAFKIQQNKTINKNNTNEDSGRLPRIRALEIGSYIGYSAIRIGKVLSSEANPGSSLLSVEQNKENAGYAKDHVKYAGLNEIVTVRHVRIEDCSFDTDDLNDMNDDNNEPQRGASDRYSQSEIQSTSTSPITKYTVEGSQSESRRRRRPFDLVFFDHRKPFYLRDLKLLESKGAVDSNYTTLVADNVASIEHMKNREEAISRGKRKGPCKCTNRACDYLEYVKRTWASTQVFYGENTKDGISISKPFFREDIVSSK